MARHKHADLIHAWAEGAEIEYKNCSGEWVNVGSTPRFITSIEYRIKPKEPEWWENIPKHGVLCWVNDIDGGFQNPAIACVIEIEQRLDQVFVTIDGITWKFAKPLTNEELERFKR